jgi:transposase
VNQRFVVFGALDYASGQLFHTISSRKDTSAFLGFLDDLVRHYPDAQVVLVLDNVGYHTSHQARAWWRAHHECIQPLWLPAYTPQLNLIERVWRHLKDELACHRWWNDLDALQEATTTLLRQMEAHFDAPSHPRIRLGQDFCEPA